jgi:hypothetical protein
MWHETACALFKIVDRCTLHQAINRTAAMVDHGTGSSLLFGIIQRTTLHGYVTAVETCDSHDFPPNRLNAMACTCTKKMLEASPQQYCQ